MKQNYQKQTNISIKQFREVALAHIYSLFNEVNNTISNLDLDTRFVYGLIFFVLSFQGCGQTLQT